MRISGRDARGVAGIVNDLGVVGLRVAGAIGGGGPDGVAVAPSGCLFLIC